MKSLYLYFPILAKFYQKNNFKSNFVRTKVADIFTTLIYITFFQSQYFEEIQQSQIQV